MNIGKHKVIHACALAAVGAVSTNCIAPVHAEEATVYTFKGGSDGAAPGAGLIADESGNFYGTTGAGGVGTDCADSNDGCGTIFELKAGKTEKVLYSFAGGCDGAFPGTGALTADGAGNLYGVTGGGGACNNGGNGTAFRLTPDGTETVLYAFQKAIIKLTYVSG